MPKSFDKCVKQGGRVRTVSGPSKEHGLKKGQYVRFCFLDNKSYRGEVKKKASEILLFSPLSFQEKDGIITSEIELIPSGDWKDSVLGDLRFSKEEFADMIKNFPVRARDEGIPVTVGHPRVDEEGRREELPAVGWIKKIFEAVNDKGKDIMKGLIEWTKDGAKLIKTGEFKYISPEIVFNYVDPEGGEDLGTTLTTAALTNFPFFKELATIKLSENVEAAKRGGESKTVARTKEELKDLLAGDPNLEPEGDEEAKLVEELKSEAKAEAEKAEAEKKKAEEEADLKAKEEEEEKAKKASEKKVSLSESEVKKLREDSNVGKEAHKKLTKMEIAGEVETLTFSETNKEGKIFKDQAEKIKAFATILSEKKRKEFFEILKSFKSLGSLFKEIGAGGQFAEDEIIPEGVSKESHETDKRIRKIMAEKDVSYAEAFSEVADEEAAERKAGR